VRSFEAGAGAGPAITLLCPCPGVCAPQLASKPPATRPHNTTRCTVSRRSHPPAEQRGYEVTRGKVMGCERLARQWHARGQGFKSPQLHQAQRIGSTPTQGRLSADCQQITPCGRNNALSAARFRRLQAILTRRIGHEQGRPGHGRGSAPAAHLDPLTTATPNPRSRLWPRSWGRACVETRQPPRRPGPPGAPATRPDKAPRQRRLMSMSQASERVTGGPASGYSTQVPTTVPWPQSP